MRRILLLLLVTLAFGVFSCVKDDPEFYDTEISFGIRHDISLSEYEELASRNSPDLPDFASVVFFSYSLDGNPEQDYIATGTVIDENWILTAGHNFYDAEQQNSPVPARGISVLIGNDPNFPDASYDVSELVFHPGWLAGNQDYGDANDLCLVKLSTPIGLTPVGLYDTDDEALGRDVWFCGFGDYSQRPGNNPDLFSRKHAIKNILDRKRSGFTSASGGVHYPGGLLAFDFDDPDGVINALGDRFVSTDEALLGPGTSMAGALDFEGTTVEGDSGGPLFVNKDGVWKLAGVLSGGADIPIEDHEDSSYGDISIFIRVSTSVEWIISVVR